MSHTNARLDKYKKIADLRKSHVDAILNCPSRKKTVVAGPGTGKTYLFKNVLAEKDRCLTLTFVNALVEDLSLVLCNHSEVKTLHGYARGVLGSNVKVFPKLSEVIKQDAKILNNLDIDFDTIFHNKENNNSHISFFKKRKDYYDNYYGYSSLIFAAVRKFETHKDKIPSYQYVVVDEFQDFNKLEVSLIELLAENSPILLAGDDDQALYGFKGASADHIRQRHNKKNTNYSSFTLPYCSRCTRAIVDAVNALVAKANEKGNLRGRISKDFLYFESEEKDKESDLYPKLDYAQVFAKQIPWFITQQMNNIVSEQQNPFSSLIIAPTNPKCRSIVDGLKKKGFRAIESITSKKDNEIGLLDGLKLLMDDNKSNLGWRIAAKHFLSASQFKSLLTKTTESDPKNILDIIDKKTKKKVKGLLKILKAVNNAENIDDDDLNTVLKEIGMDMHKMKIDAVSNRIISSPYLPNPGLKKMPIKVTTIQSAKGLSADFVFITYFDDRYFIKNTDKSKITDQDICNFIVSLTRAKKKVFLISSSKTSEPTFLSWINSNLINKVS